MRTLGIVGTGLIGGSVALACRERGIFDEFAGLDKDCSKLEIAIQLGVCDRPLTSGENLDAICVSVPTGSIASTIESLSTQFSADVPIFDVGSVKGSILKELHEVPENFVPSHPIAGSEKSGAHEARADLFNDSVCVITPSSGTNSRCVDRVKEIWEGIGARVIELSPETHDVSLGLTSHLPHLLSYAIVEMLSEENEIAHGLVGTGFKDFSRIAEGDARVWSDILSANAGVLAEQTDQLIEKLLEIVRLAQTDKRALSKRIDQVRSFRQSLYD